MGVLRGEKSLLWRWKRITGAILLLSLIRLLWKRRQHRAKLFAESAGPKVPQETDVEVDGKRFSPVVVKTSKGPVKGFKANNHGVYTFRGIPYAAPPTGSRRFKRPVDHPGWDTVLDCTRFGVRSIQYPLQNAFHLLRPAIYTIKQRAYEMVFGYGFGLSWKKPMPESNRQGEDCLTINVCTPSLLGKRPVLVYIHGGAFVVGSCCEAIFNQPWGHPLAAEQDIVVVHFTYRLGALGFLKVEGGDYNCGLYDQVHALRWVNREIHRFGGDPENVTIMGQSAGAMSVACLMSSFAVRYFNRSVLQSGAGHNASDMRTATRVSHAFAQVLGVKPDSLTAFSLRSLSAQQIWTAQMQVIAKGTVLMPFQPVVDGELVPAPPIECIARGTARHVDLLIGYTLDEWGMFNRFNPVRVGLVPKWLLSRVVEQYLGPTIAPNQEAARKHAMFLIQRYQEDLRHQHNGSLDWDLVLARLVTETVFVSPSHVLAEAHFHSRSPGVKTFKYRFEFASRYGAMHALDNPFFHGTLQSETYPEDIKDFVASGGPVTKTSTDEDIEHRFQQAVHLGKEITHALARFVEASAPCTRDGDKWPEYNPSSRPVMVLDFPACHIQYESPQVENIDQTSTLEYLIKVRKEHLHGFGRLSFMDDDKVEEVDEISVSTRYNQVLSSPQKRPRSRFH